MNSTRRTFLRSLLLLPLLLGSVAAAGEAPPLRTLRVLFIGNSYTYGNDLPGLIAQLLPARGIKLEHESVTPGGATLEKQWADGKALAAIRKKKWDYVVLQEQSARPFRDREAMFKAARLLHAEIAKTGAKTLLYETWAAKASPGEQPKLSDAYETLGRELGASVVPAGEAWKKAIAAGFELHGGDGRHPNRRGSYLAACLFVAVLTGESPIGLPSEGTTEGKPWSVADAPALQRIAVSVKRQASNPSGLTSFQPRTICLLKRAVPSPSTSGMTMICGNAGAKRKPGHRSLACRPRPLPRTTPRCQRHGSRSLVPGLNSPNRSSWLCVRSWPRPTGAGKKPLPCPRGRIVCTFWSSIPIPPRRASACLKSGWRTFPPIAWMCLVVPVAPT